MPAAIIPTVPAAGYIDLHCHLLPGIDDGCQNLELSLQCIRKWIAAGFSGAVCTPHLATHWFPENTPQRVNTWTLQLQAAITEAKLPFLLWSGGEVRLSDRTIGWWEQHGIPTLGPGRCVLIDWWGQDWPPVLTKACRYLLDRKYQPILAHPERMGLPERELQAVIHELMQLGIWLQGNLNSLSGGEGEQAERRAQLWLKNDSYYTLASDTHEPNSIATRVAGLEWVRREHGEEPLWHWLGRRPREILLHGVAT